MPETATICPTLTAREKPIHRSNGRRNKFTHSNFGLVVACFMRCLASRSFGDETRMFVWIHEHGHYDSRNLFIRRRRVFAFAGDSRTPR
jgi:hypothetical protein